MNNLLKFSLFFFFVLFFNQYGTSNPPQEKQYDIVKIETTFGNIFIWLYTETPKHRENFIKLANDGFYNGTTYHRVIKNFMIQGGDPTSKGINKANIGNGGPGYTIPAEFKTEFIHKKGALAAARQGDNVNPKKASSGSQFYIVQGIKYTSAQLDASELKMGTKFTKAQREAYTTVGGTPHLDGGYTVYGEVISGLDVVDKIAEQKTDQRNMPVIDIKMKIGIVKLTAAELKKKYNFTPK